MKRIISISLMLSFCLFLQFNIFAGSQQQNYPQGRYSNRADSLRKDNLTPRRDDSVQKSQSDKQPVLKSDSFKDSPKPVKEPEKSQHNPAIELSDTIKRQ